MSPGLAPDQNRRLESVVRFGTVSAVDPARALCRARSGGLETDWLAWGERRAGAVRDWDPPSVGEQCVIFSPSGETGAGAVLTGLFQDASPPPEDSPDVTARHWPDGARQRYDSAAHEWLLEAPPGGKIVIRIGATSLEMTDAGLAIDAPSVTVRAPPITLQGNVLVLGGLTGQPGPEGGSGGGSATFRGRIDAEVDVRVVPPSGAGAVSLKDHTHAGVQRGGASTDRPSGGG